MLARRYLMTLWLLLKNVCNALRFRCSRKLLMKYFKLSFVSVALKTLIPIVSPPATTLNVPCFQSKADSWNQNESPGADLSITPEHDKWSEKVEFNFSSLLFIQIYDYSNPQHWHFWEYLVGEKFSTQKFNKLESWNMNFPIIKIRPIKVFQLCSCPDRE